MSNELDNTLITPAQTQVDVVAESSSDEQTLGRFRLETLLGEGAFGRVYRAYDPDLDRVIALKVAKTGRFSSEEDVQRFLREARAAAQLRHQHLVPVYESGREADSYFIVSGFVEGATLRETLKNGRTLSVRATVDLVAKIASALHFAHVQGIVHRDVKPANIMIDRDGEPQIMDFGLASRHDDDLLKTQAGTRMGTPAYMSPEQAGGDSHLADARSDVWSVGVILYELLCQRRPFDGKIVDVIRDIQTVDPKPPRKINAAIPRDLETICLKALERDRNRRFASAKELADELHRWLRDEPILSRPIGLIERTMRWIKRNPLLTAFLASLVMGMGASAYFARRAQNQEKTANDRATTISEQSGELKTINAALSQSNTELKASITARNKALKSLQRRTAENDLNQGVTECRNGRVSHGLLYFARALETVPAGEDGLVFSIRTNITTWRTKLHALNWQVETRADGIPVAKKMRQGDDGKRLVTIHPGQFGKGGTIRVWDPQTGQPIGKPMVPKHYIIEARITADGKSVVAVERDYSNRGGVSKGKKKQIKSRIVQWNIADGRQRKSPIVIPGFVKTAAVDPQRLRVFVSVGNPGGKQIGQIWDVRTSRAIATLTNDDKAIMLDAAFSPDGRFLITHCSLPRGKPSANSGYLAGRRVVRIHDSRTGDTVDYPAQHNLTGQLTLIRQLRLAITSLNDGRHKMAVWRYSDFGSRIVSPQRYDPNFGPVIGFGLRGRRTITVDSRQAGLPRIQIRDKRTGDVVGQPLPGTQAVLCGDEDTAVVLSNGKLKSWYLAGSVPESILSLQHEGRPLSPPAMRLSVELLTGMTFSENGEVYYFDESVRKEKQRTLRQLLRSPVKTRPL